MHAYQLNQHLHGHHIVPEHKTNTIPFQPIPSLHLVEKIHPLILCPSCSWQHFLKSYTELLIKTCHKRGVHAMGGMVNTSLLLTLTPSLIYSFHSLFDQILDLNTHLLTERLFLYPTRLLKCALFTYDKCK